MKRIGQGSDSNCTRVIARGEEEKEIEEKKKKKRKR
jgi:hypothetical protein